jgi:hypothetical protein
VVLVSDMESRKKRRGIGVVWGKAFDEKYS